MAYKSFEDLKVWQASCRLAVRVYKELRDTRDYGLKDQMTRAAVSIASNIAEGAERNSPPDYQRFLHIAKGSAAELRTQVYIACRVGETSKESANQIAGELKGISARLQALITSLNKKHNT